ncbi:MAG: sulfotransferase [Kiritimatiellia bacterium]
MKVAELFIVFPDKARILIKYYWNKLLRGIRVDSPPVFIVGCGHSGTSLLLAILDAHPGMHGIPYESNCVKEGRINRFNKAQKKFNKLTIAAGKRRWVEKTPLHIKRIATILEYSPDAKVVLIIRDGRDVAYSIKKRRGSLEDGINRWVNDNKAGEKFWDNPNVHVVKYEDIITDFESAITSVLSFLGEKYYPEMRNFNLKGRRWYSRSLAKPENFSGKNHKQYRNWQINQPLFDGRNKWKDLSADELSFIYKSAGLMLDKLGYTQNADL